MPRVSSFNHQQSVYKEYSLFAKALSLQLINPLGSKLLNNTSKTSRRLIMRNGSLAKNQEQIRDSSGSLSHISSSMVKLKLKSILKELPSMCSYCQPIQEEKRKKMKSLQSRLTFLESRVELKRKHYLIPIATNIRDKVSAQSSCTKKARE